MHVQQLMAQMARNCLIKNSLWTTPLCDHRQEGVEARDRARKGNSYNEEGVEVQVQEGRHEMMSEPVHRKILMFEDMIY